MAIIRNRKRGSLAFSIAFSAVKLSVWRKLEGMRESCHWMDLGSESISVHLAFLVRTVGHIVVVKA
jgi:hypothetical protein